MYDTGGYTEIVVREFIPCREMIVPCIYNGTPLRNEVRIFYNMNTNQIEYVVDYWDYEYCYSNLNTLNDRIVFEWFHNQSNYDETIIYMIDYIYQNISTIKFSNNLKGIWSIDFMLVNDLDSDRNGIYLIDMARGYRSAYWDPSKIRSEINEK